MMILFFVVSVMFVVGVVLLVRNMLSFVDVGLGLFGFVFGLVFGFVFGLVLGLVLGFVFGFVLGLVLGFVFGLVLGFVFGFVLGFVFGFVLGLVGVGLNIVFYCCVEMEMLL